eukprot:gb/GEZN01017554.1/.p1 GENE.gb/GEZN01017554.1/~~gb/GEZN01017554.1/.p1  ORF type:complete len:170 (+),score=20.07 gb/GEZN01017554.1/:27-536(+)
MALRSQVGRLSAVVRSSAVSRSNIFAVRHFSSVDPEDYNALKIPKGVEPGTVPGVLNRASGKQFTELAAETLGRERFEQGPIITDFGTMEKPAEIPSMFPSRIVGCVGDNHHKKHPLLWFDLQTGHKHVCAECGQVFKLVKAQPLDFFTVPPAKQQELLETFTKTEVPL